MQDVREFQNLSAGEAVGEFSQPIFHSFKFDPRTGRIRRKRISFHVKPHKVNTFLEESCSGAGSRSRPVLRDDDASDQL